MKGDCVPDPQDDYTLELVRVRNENGQLKNQNNLLLRLAKQAIIQSITSMDMATFLQFMTAYEELRR